jgi:hypothetical protein
MKIRAGLRASSFLSQLSLSQIFFYGSPSGKAPMQPIPRGALITPKE